MNDARTLDRPVQPTLQVRQIVAGQNYREHYDAKALADLREQVKAAGGIKSPIMVRPHPTRDGVWEIVYGHRRWMVAGEQYGDTYDMPVVIREASDADSEAIALIENYHRAGMSVAEAFEGVACPVPQHAEPQGEAVCFGSDGAGYYTVSEGSQQPIYFFAKQP